VRGKNILWLSMVFLMLSVMMVNIGKTADEEIETKIYIDPKRLPEDPSTLGHPGDSYIVSVEIENVTDLWAASFKIQIYPYGRILVASEITMGPFLGSDGYEVAPLAYNIDVFHGIIDIGISRWRSGPWVEKYGISGSGTLVTFKLTVVEAGNSPITLFDVVLVDSNENHIPYHILHQSYYYGVTASLVRMRLGKRPLQTQTFASKVKNEGDLPLYVKVIFSNIREDGARFSFGAGQAFTTAPPRPSEYLYVDGFDFTREQWNAIGTAPYLDAIEDGNMIEGTYDTAQHRWFTFQDIDLSDGAMIKDVWIEGYTKGPYNEGVDYDIYTGDFDWLGSLYAKGDWAWVGTRWVGGASASDLVPALATEEGLNNLKVLVYFYDPDGYGGAGNFIDSLRLFYPPVSPIEPVVYTLQPEETLELDPATWILRSDDVGRYTVTATVYYSYYGVKWIPGEKVMTRSWWVEPALAYP